MRPTYACVDKGQGELGESVRVGEEEREEGLVPICGESWVASSHFMNLQLYKWDITTWRTLLSASNPAGQWPEQQVGDNVWLTQKTDPRDLRPPPLNGVGGPFQTWLLPIGDTGYAFGLNLGTSLESFKQTQAYAHLQATLRHVAASFKIEPLSPAIEAEMAQLNARAGQVQRQEGIEQAKRSKPFPRCEKYLKP